MLGSEAAVWDKVLLFGLSCANNCVTHDPQLLTTMTFWHTQAARPFQHPAHEFQDLFERFLRMEDSQRPKGAKEAMPFSEGEAVSSQRPTGTRLFVESMRWMRSATDRHTLHPFRK